MTSIEPLSSICSLLKSNHFCEFLLSSNIEKENFLKLASEVSTNPEKCGSTLFEILAADVNFTGNFAFSNNQTKKLVKGILDQETKAGFKFTMDKSSEDTMSQSSKEESSKRSQPTSQMPKYRKMRCNMSSRADCIRKRIKSLFHKYVIASLNTVTRKMYKTVNFKPLPKFLQKVLNLKENKIWITMSLRDLLTFSEASFSNVDTANFINNLKSLRLVESSSIIREYLNKSWETLYQEFLDSEAFKSEIAHYEEISLSYASRFKNLSLDLIRFINH